MFSGELRTPGMGKFIKIAILSVFLFCLGIATSLQIKSTIAVNSAKAQAVIKLEQLKINYENEKKLRARLEQENKMLEDQKLQYMKKVADLKDDDEIKKQMAYLEQLKFKAGVSDVKGPGITITLDDAELKSPELLSNYTIDPNELIIHDTYILDTLNELKKAGAQAISVNNERIVSISEVICAGTTILINKKRFAVPYEIKAIGDPDTLDSVYRNSQVFAVMLSRGIRVDIKKSREIVIPKFNDARYNLNKLSEVLEVIKNETE